MTRITWTDDNGASRSLTLPVSFETARALVEEDLEIARAGGDSVFGRLSRGEPMIQTKNEIS